MKIFLSFALADREWADELTASLQSDGTEILRSEVTFPVSNGEEPLRQSLMSADVVVPILTERSAHSPKLLFEVGAAIGAGRRIVSLVIGGANRLAFPRFLTRPSSEVKVSQYPIEAETPQEAAERLKNCLHSEQLVTA